MAKQTTLAAAAAQTEPARVDTPTYDPSQDDHIDSYVLGVGVPITHPAHDPSKPGRMPYELNQVPSAIK